MVQKKGGGEPAVCEEKWTPREGPALACSIILHDGVNFCHVMCPGNMLKVTLLTESVFESLRVWRVRCQRRDCRDQLLTGEQEV